MSTVQIRHTVSPLPDDIAPVLVTNGDSPPFTNLGTKNLVVKYSVDGGNTFSTTRTHAFGAGPFNTIASVVSDITGDATFMSGAASIGITVVAVGNELSITWPNVGAMNYFKVDSTSNAINGAGLLAYLPNQASCGAGMTARGLKIIVGSDHYGSMYVPQTGSPSAPGNYIDGSARQLIFGYTPTTLAKDDLINATKFTKSAIADLVARGKVEVLEIGVGDMTPDAIRSL